MEIEKCRQKLANILAAEAEQVPDLINAYLYRRKEVRLGSVLRSLSSHARTAAMYAYFVNRDSVALKQNCYLATRLTLASVGQPGGVSFSVGGDFLYALLSDHSEIVHALAQVETPELVRERTNPLSSHSHVYMLQLAIRDDYELLERMITKVAKNGRKGDRSESIAGRYFFSLLLKRDKSGLEELIQTKHASVKSAAPCEEDFMSFLGTIETKICWLKGIPIQIDNPLVPMKLMPITPLAHYDEIYDFLKPGWTPPRQGLLGKISRLFLME